MITYSVQYHHKSSIQTLFLTVLSQQFYEKSSLQYHHKSSIKTLFLAVLSQQFYELWEQSSLQYSIITRVPSKPTSMLLNHNSSMRTIIRTVSPQEFHHNPLPCSYITNISPQFLGHMTQHSILSLFIGHPFNYIAVQYYNIRIE